MADDKSAPVANDSRVLAHSNSKRIAPAPIAAMPNPIVKGSKSSLLLVIPKVAISGCKAGRAKIRSGSVSTAKKGSTAPILMISAKEAKIIKINSRLNWRWRRALICLQRRSKSVFKLVAGWDACSVGLAIPHSKRLGLASSWLFELERWAM